MPHLNPGRARWILAAILAVYTLLAVLFAVYTPPWQAPDEPAHYNYVRYLVDKGKFPVLQMGDYSQGYLDWIKEAKFAPILSIDGIRYEFHQPPLYYLLAAPLFAVTGGALLPLRLFSVLLGAGLVVLAYLTGRRVFPAQPVLGLAAAAFVAFLPQHLATVAQVSNDVLGELLVAALLLLLLGRIERDARADAGSRGQGVRGKADYALLGVLCGLVLITKTTAYIAVLLAGIVLPWEWRRERAALARVALELGLVVAPAALISFPWYLRDVLTYGWPDFLGLARHDSVVIGQMRLTEYVARLGWSSYAQRLVTFTFESFWGVFGWQGVPMDARVYTALAIFSAVAGVGLLARAAFLVLPGGAGLSRGLKVPAAAASGPLPADRLPCILSAAVMPPARTIRRRPAGRPAVQREGRSSGPGAARSPGWPPLAADARRGAFPGAGYALALCGLCVFLSVAVYAWYNLQFVQHQGRYLFTALIPLAMGLALGWEEALRPERSRALAAGLALLAVVLLAAGLMGSQGVPKWPVALALLSAAAFAVRPWLPARLDGLLFALPYAALPLIALYALFGAIVPQLALRLAG